jgi:cobalt/nickel transport system permease protein
VSLFAVHISDGVLAPATLVVGFVIAGLLLIPALVRIRDEEVPRIALLTAAFFVSSSIHVKVPPTSVHLLLNALVGVILGRRAPLAIVVGLFLQAALLAHGGYTTLGVNTAVIAGPAILARRLFRTLAGNSPSARRAAWAGGVTGWLTVVLTAALNAIVLIVGGIESWTIIAAPQFVIYLLLGVIEGLITGTTTGFLTRVRPDLLGLCRLPQPSSATERSVTSNV